MPRLSIGIAYLIENIDCLPLNSSQCSPPVHFIIGQKVNIIKLENNNIYFLHMGEMFLAQDYCLVDENQWNDIQESIIKEYKRLRAIKRNAKISRFKRSNSKKKLPKN